FFPELKLSKPRIDTCKTCDQYKIELADPTLPDDQRRIKVQERQFHQTKAQRGYDLPKEMKAQAGSDTWVICMDLQQALTLPKLTSGIAFYKRKLWSLNFGIHDYKTNRGYMYVWNEVTANR
ncbi:unnamed protein product, partial [Meganyctiphanes norvegica]